MKYLKEHEFVSLFCNDGRQRLLYFGVKLFNMFERIACHVTNDKNHVRFAICETPNANYTNFFILALDSSNVHVYLTESDFSKMQFPKNFQSSGFLRDQVNTPMKIITAADLKDISDEELLNIAKVSYESRSEYAARNHKCKN